MVAVGLVVLGFVGGDDGGGVGDGDGVDGEVCPRGEGVSWGGGGGGALSVWCDFS